MLRIRTYAVCADFRVGGNNLGKPCALGSVGFPYAVTCRRRTRRFRLHRASLRKPNRHLVHTIIPKLPTNNSLEDFLGRFPPALSFFAMWISSSNRAIVLAIREHVDLKSLRITQSRLHCTQRWRTA